MPHTDMTPADPLPGQLTFDDLAAETRITCPACGRTSHNRDDIREGYCGHCHDWTTPRP